VSLLCRGLTKEDAVFRLCRLTEEATNGDASPPNAKTMGLIARQAFDIDEYVRILDILHTRSFLHLLPLPAAAVFLAGSMLFFLCSPA
jgi:hypothetical protein